MKTTMLMNNPNGRGTRSQPLYSLYVIGDRSWSSSAALILLYSPSHAGTTRRVRCLALGIMEKKHIKKKW